MSKKKYDITIVETLIHSFTIDVESDEDPYEAAEETLAQAEKISELTNYGLVVSHREVETAIPQ